MDGGALTGIRIADFAWAWAGAHATELLAFMGAEVIRIESRTRPDHSRLRSFTTNQRFNGVDQSSVFNDINLNKLGVSINLKHAKGVELAKRIVGLSDVAVQNMRPGVMERLGLGYDDLRMVRPDIIYLSSSARGATGPELAYSGYAPVFAALGGISYMTGYADDAPAYMTGEIDLLSAATAAFAILAALHHQARTGEGQYIDLSSSESISVLIGDAILDYTMRDMVQPRKGNRDNGWAPHNCYRCKGEDKWVSVVTSTEEEWRAFCKALGELDWTRDDKFSDNSRRWENQEEMDRLIEEWTINHTSHEVMNTLQSVGVAAVASLSSEELFHDPHLKERGLWTKVKHPVIGEQVVALPPWKLSVTPVKVNHAAPLLGEHNQYVFGELLGMSKEEIAALEEEEILY